MSDIIMTIKLCEETGEHVIDNVCPTHGGGTPVDADRRGFTYPPMCAALYHHNAYLRNGTIKVVVPA